MNNLDSNHKSKVTSGTVQFDEWRCSDVVTTAHYYFRLVYSVSSSSLPSSRHTLARYSCHNVQARSRVIATLRVTGRLGPYTPVDPLCLLMKMKS